MLRTRPVVPLRHSPYQSSHALFNPVPPPPLSLRVTMTKAWYATLPRVLERAWDIGMQVLLLLGLVMTIVALRQLVGTQA